LLAFNVSSQQKTLSHHSESATVSNRCCGKVRVITAGRRPKHLRRDVPKTKQVTRANFGQLAHPLSFIVAANRRYSASSIGVRANDGAANFEVARHVVEAIDMICIGMRRQT